MGPSRVDLPFVEHRRVGQVSHRGQKKVLRRAPAHFPPVSSRSASCCRFEGGRGPACRARVDVPSALIIAHHRDVWAIGHPRMDPASGLQGGNLGTPIDYKAATDTDEVGVVCCDTLKWLRALVVAPLDGILMLAAITTHTITGDPHLPLDHYDALQEQWNMFRLLFSKYGLAREEVKSPLRFVSECDGWFAMFTVVCR